MHELKVARSQALTTREMAQIGLFTALIAAGAYIKINIPVHCGNAAKWTTCRN